MTKQEQDVDIVSVFSDSLGTGAPVISLLGGRREAGGLPCDTSLAILPLSASEQMVAAGVEVLYQLEGEVTKATLARQLWAAMAEVLAHPILDQGAPDEFSTCRRSKF